MPICTSLDENLFKSIISGSKLLRLLSFAFHEEEDEDEEAVTLYFIPGVTFTSYFLRTVTILRVLHLDVLKR